MPPIYSCTPRSNVKPELICFAPPAACLSLCTCFYTQDDVYRFPYTEVCLGAGSGCSWDEAECVGTVNATVFDPCDYVLDVQIESAPTVSSSTTIRLKPYYCRHIAVVYLVPDNTLWRNRSEMLSAERFDPCGSWSEWDTRWKSDT